MHRGSKLISAHPKDDPLCRRLYCVDFDSLVLHIRENVLPLANIHIDTIERRVITLTKIQYRIGRVSRSTEERVRIYSGPSSTDAGTVDSQVVLSAPGALVILTSRGN